MSAPKRGESDLLAPVVEVLRGAVSPPTAADLERGLATLRKRRSTPTRAPSRPLVLLATAGCGLALGMALISAVSHRASVPPRPVTIQRIEGGKVLEGGYLSEIGHGGMALHFSEGSKFVLTPGSRGRLRETAPEGARFELDHGTASFQITPGPQRNWSVEAGPFVVSIRGTDFTVVWEPTTEQFEVELRRGRVAVRGPLGGEELVLRPGQRLRVNLSRGETAIAEIHAEPAAPDASISRGAPMPSAPASAPTAAGPNPSAATTPRGSSAEPERERRFGQALANGRWDRILAEVERDGIETSVRTLSSEDLFALADAARYKRRPDLARAALLAQRERFPGSPRSLDALFLLGRVDELRGGGRAAAIQSYDEYLSRAPAGTYAAEALGRKMILVKEAEGPERARQIAEDYLSRFPHGSYAEVARTLRALP